MKIILAGSTGYIGTSTLTHLLEHPKVTQILLLTRRPHPSPTISSHPKITTILLDDFSTYPATTTSQFSSASAAIWCVGTYTGSETVDVTYPLAFLAAVKASGAKLRYVHLGGGFTEPPPAAGEPERALWYFVNGRRVRGRAEAEVMKCEGGGTEVFVVKPGAVMSWGAGWLGYVLGEGLHVGLDEVAAVMVELAVEGGERRVWLNRDLVRRGAELVEARRGG